jgi:hypothetical protein
MTFQARLHLNDFEPSVTATLRENIMFCTKDYVFLLLVLEIWNFRFYILE